MGISNSQGFQEAGLRIVLLGVREYERNSKLVEKSTAGIHTSIEKSGAAVSKASRGIGTYSDKMTSASSGSGALSKASTALSDKMLSLGKSFTSVGASLTAGVSIPLTLLQYQLFDIGVDFEDAFSAVSKTVDGISDDFGNFTDTGLEFRENLISLTRELPLTANELSAVAAAAGQVGVPFGDSGATLLEFTKIASGLGVATDVMAQDAAVALARVSNIYGIAAEDMVSFSQGFANSLVALGNTTAATESEILSMTMRLAPAASLAGIAADQTLALAASMTEMGINAEAGGTALSTIILTMTEASKVVNSGGDTTVAATKQMEGGLNKLRKALKEGVTDFTALEFVLKDTGLNLEGVSSMMKKLEDGTYSIDNIIQHVSMNTMMDMQKAMDDAATKTEIFADVLGVSEEEFAAAFGADPLQTLQRFLVELADLQDAGQISSETLAELGFSGIRVRQVINTLGPNMENLTGNVELSNKAWIEQTALQVEVQKRFATTKAQIQLLKNAVTELGIAIFDQLKPGYDALVESITDVILKFTDFFKASNENSKLVINIATAIIALGPALAGVGIALRVLSKIGASSALASLFGLLTNPFVLVSLGAIAAGFAIIKSDVLGLGESLRWLGNAVSNVFGTIMQSFKLLGIDKVLGGVFKDLSSGNFSQAFDGIKLAWELIKVSIERDILPEIKKQFTVLKVLFKPAFDQLINWITTTGVDLLSKAIQTLVKLGIQGTLLTMGAGTSIFDSIMSNIFGKDTELNKSFNSFVDTLTRFSPLINAAFVEIFSSVKEGDFSGAFKKFTSLITLLLKITGTQIKIEFPKILTGISDLIVKYAPIIFNKLKEWGSAFLNWAVTDGKDAVIGAISLLSSAISGILGELFGGEVFTSVMQLGGAITGTVSGIADFVSELLKTDPSKLKGFGDLLVTVFEAIVFAIDTIATAIELGGEPLGIFLRGLLETVGELLEGDIQGAFSSITDAINELVRLPIEQLAAGFLLLVGAFRLFSVGGVISSLIAPLVSVATAMWGLVAANSALLISLAPLLIIVAAAGLIIAAYKTNFMGFGDAVDRAVQGWKTFGESVLVIGKLLWDFITTTNWISLGSDIVNGIWNGLKSAWESFWSWVTGKFQELIDYVLKLLGISSPSKVFSDIGKNIVQGLLDGVNSLWNTFKEWVENSFNWVIDTVKNTLSGLLQIGKDAITYLWNGMKELWQTFSLWVYSKALEIVSKFRDILTKLYNTGLEIINNIGNGMSNAWNNFITWVGQKADSIKNSFSGIISGMRDIGRDIINGLWQGLEDAWDMVPDIFKDIINSGIDVVDDILKRGSPSKVFMSIGEDIVSGLVVGLKNAEAGLLDTISTLSADMIVTGQMQQGNISHAMLGAATGSTINNSYGGASSITNSTTFAPTITGVPMQDESSMGREAIRAWRQAQMIGNI